MVTSSNPMQEHIAEILQSRERTIPIFLYKLDGYDEVNVATVAPIHVGDYVSVRLPDNTYLQQRKVIRIHHIDETINVGKQVLTSFIELEPD